MEVTCDTLLSHTFHTQSLSKLHLILSEQIQHLSCSRRDVVFSSVAWGETGTVLGTSLDIFFCNLP